MSKHHEAGLSLIELVTFIALSSFFVLASLSLLQLMPFQATKPLLKSMLIDLAQQEINQFEAMSFGDIAVGDFETFYPEYNISILTRIEHRGDTFLLDHEAVKRMSVTAKHSDTHNINLAVYRFDE